MSEQSEKIKMRSLRPVTIAGAIGGLMRIIGARASDADLARRWDEIMGDDIASVAKLATIRKTRNNKFNVVIRPVVPAYALQLSYMAPDITERINKYFGYDAVEKISFRK